MERKIKAKQILQLRSQGLSRRAIESAQGMSKAAASKPETGVRSRNGRHGSGGQPSR
jgi:hypothetical protein